MEIKGKLFAKYWKTNNNDSDNCRMNRWKGHMISQTFWNIFLFLKATILFMLKKKFSHSTGRAKKETISCVTFNCYLLFRCLTVLCTPYPIAINSDELYLTRKPTIKNCVSSNSEFLNNFPGDLLPLISSFYTQSWWSKRTRLSLSWQLKRHTTVTSLLLMNF